MAQPGEILCGRFRVLRSLGTPGAIGEVYRVHDDLTDIEAALKLARFYDADTRAEFLTQFRTLFGIRTPALPRPLGYFQHEENGYERPAILMELVEGKTLDDFERTDPPLQHRVFVLQQLAEAIAALHVRGVLHGDVHPRNVIVTPDERFERSQVALIDPASDRFGSTTSGERSFESPSLALDLQGLGVLLRTLLGSKTRRFDDAIHRLECGTADAESTAALLRTALVNGFFVADPSPTSPAVAFKLRRTENRKTFVRFRLAREAELERFDGEVQEIANEWGVHASGWEAEISEPTKYEAYYDDSDIGNFAGRHYNVRAGEGEWRLFIKAATQFGKPWPFGEPGILSQGISQLAHLGVDICAEDLEIRAFGGAARLVTQDVGFPTNHLWIERNLSVCTRQLQPLRSRGFALRAEFSPRRSEGAAERLRAALAERLEIWREVDFGLRAAEGIVPVNDVALPVLAKLATDSVVAVEDDFHSLYALDMTYDRLPRTRFELQYLLTFSDGTPIRIRFEVELLRSTPVLVTVL